MIENDAAMYYSFDPSSAASLGLHKIVASLPTILANYDDENLMTSSIRAPARRAAMSLPSPIPLVSRQHLPLLFHTLQYFQFLSS